MNNDLKISITIDKKTGALKVLNKELKDVSTSSNRAGKSINDVGSSVRSMGYHMLGFVGASKVIDTFGVQSVKTFSNIEYSLTQLKLVTGANEKQFTELSSRARELGKSTIFSTKEASSGMYYLAKAGLNTEQVLGSVSSALNLAKIGNLDLGTSADIVTNIMSSMGVEAKDLESTVDQMIATFTASNTDVTGLGESFKYVGSSAKLLGLNTKEVLSGLGTLGSSGLGGSIGGTTLNNMLLGFTEKTSEATAVLKKLKVSFIDDKGNFIGFEKALRKLKVSMEGVGNADKLKMLGKIFKIEGAKGAAILLDNLDTKYAELSTGIANASGLQEEFNKELSETTEEHLKRASSAFSALQDTIGNKLAPTVKSLSKTFADLFGYMNTSLQDIEDMETTTSISEKIAQLEVEKDDLSKIGAGSVWSFLGGTLDEELALLDGQIKLGYSKLELKRKEFLSKRHIKTTSEIFNTDSITKKISLNPKKTKKQKDNRLALDKAYYTATNNLAKLWALEKQDILKKYVGLNKSKIDEVVAYEKDKFFEASQNDFWANIDEQFEKDINKKIIITPELESLRTNVGSLFENGIQDALNGNLNLSSLSKQIGSAMTGSMAKNLSQNIMDSDITKSVTSSLLPAISSAAPYLAGAMMIAQLIPSLLDDGIDNQGELDKIKALEDASSHLEISAKALSSLNLTGSVISNNLKQANNDYEKDIRKALTIEYDTSSFLGMQYDTDTYDEFLNKRLAKKAGYTKVYEDIGDGYGITEQHIQNAYTKVEDLNIDSLIKEMNEAIKDTLPNSKARLELINASTKATKEYNNSLLDNVKILQDTRNTLINAYESITSDNTFTQQKVSVAKNDLYKDTTLDIGFSKNDFSNFLGSTINKLGVVDNYKISKLQQAGKDTELNDYLKSIFKDTLGTDTESILNNIENIKLISASYEKEANTLKELQQTIDSLNPKTKVFKGSLNSIARSIIDGTTDAKEYVKSLREENKQKLNNLNTNKQFVLSIKSTYSGIEEQIRGLSNEHYTSNDINKQISKITSSKDEYLQDEISTFNNMLQDYSSVMKSLDANTKRLKDYTKDLLSDKELSILSREQKANLALTRYTTALDKYKAGDNTQADNLQKYSKSYLSSIRETSTKDEYTDKFISMQGDLQGLTQHSNTTQDNSLLYLTQVKDILATREPLIQQGIEGIETYFTTEEALLKSNINSTLDDLRTILEQGIATNVSVQVSPIQISVNGNKDGDVDVSVQGGASRMTSANTTSATIDYTSKLKDAGDEYKKYVNNLDYSNFTPSDARKMRAIASRYDQYSSKLGKDSIFYSQVDEWIKTRYGFEVGGYTPDVGTKVPTGLVHGGEWVMPEWMVKKQPSMAQELEKIRLKGYQSGGFTSSSSLQSSNNANGLSELKLEIKEIKQLLKENAIINQESLRYTKGIARKEAKTP